MITIIQHHSKDGLGTIIEWISGRRMSIQLVEPNKYPLPDPNLIDRLIILGGPMSANDEDIPWLESELRFVRNFLSLEKPILGICLGAQIIAKVSGGVVNKCIVKEHGWHSIVNCGFYDFPANVFQWHSECFTLPPNASLQAHSMNGQNEAFITHDKSLAVQFHYEMNKEKMIEMAAHFGTPRTLLNSGRSTKFDEIYYDKLKISFFETLDRLFL